jgi:hypothetical protein
MKCWPRIYSGVAMRNTCTSQAVAMYPYFNGLGSTGLD